MTKHTPGPWFAHWPEIRAYGGIVAELNTIESRGEADARLIAAAPDLLSALQKFVQLSQNAGVALTAEHIAECKRDIINHCHVARALIAKAGGAE